MNKFSCWTNINEGISGLGTINIKIKAHGSVFHTWMQYTNWCIGYNIHNSDYKKTKKTFIFKLIGEHSWKK